MTIDEAIKMLNAKAECINKVCKGTYEECNEDLCDNCELLYAKGNNGEQKELCLSCVEWLYELKKYRRQSVSIEAFEKMDDKKMDRISYISKKYKEITGNDNADDVPIYQMSKIVLAYEKGRAYTIAEIERAMYHEAFEVDHVEDGMQKWDGGNWIRYKLFYDVLRQVKEQK